MKKRLLAWLLCLCLLAGILPIPAIAAVLQSLPLASNNSRMQVEQSTVEVWYHDLDRSQATITYHKEGIQADSFNLIFLVDTSRQGVDSARIFRQMMFDSGIGYIFDHNASSRAQLITYQNTAKDSGVQYHKGTWSAEISSISAGEGTANEPAALDAAIKAVQDAKAKNSFPTVVFWVLGEEIIQPKEEIEPKLQELKSELENENGALVTWQYADQPNELLAKYATQYTGAHDDPSEDKLSAAYAAADAVVMQEKMAANLEELVHDHYHNIHFSLLLDEGQTLVKEITNFGYRAASSMASLTPPFGRTAGAWM